MAIKGHIQSESDIGDKLSEKIKELDSQKRNYEKQIKDLNDNHKKELEKLQQSQQSLPAIDDPILQDYETKTSILQNKLNDLNGEITKIEKQRDDAIKSNHHLLII